MNRESRPKAPGRYRHHRPAVSARFLVAGLLFAAVLHAQAALFVPEAVDLGPILTRDTDLTEQPRIRAIGPVFEGKELDDDALFRAIRPLFSAVYDRDAVETDNHLLWPVGSYRRHLSRANWRCLLVFGSDSDTTDSHSRYHVWAFPVLFFGRDRHDEDYFGLFPLGGKLKEFLGRDTIVFVLFPLYAYSRVNDVRTHDVLWPIFSRSKGKQLSRWRVFPFYGREDMPGRSEKHFIAWPFWSFARYHYPGSAGYAFVLFPLFGRVNLENQQSWMLLPPFFRWTRTKERREAYFPWPFLQVSSGDIDKLYVWPLWGRKNTDDSRYTFALWPIFSKRERWNEHTIRRRFAARPVFYCETLSRQPDATGKPGEQLSKYVKVWPFVSFEKNDTMTRLRSLDLWPMRNPPGIERNWAPFWTLYSYERGPRECSHELLWGLFRRRRNMDGGVYTSLFPLVAWHASGQDGQTRSWSILKGLIGYDRQGSHRTLRLLYFLRFRRDTPPPWTRPARAP